MRCCVCKEREAKVHYTQIEAGKTHKLDLCEECAKAKGVSDPGGFGLASEADMVLGLGAGQEIEQAAAGGILKCSRCGFSQADFKKAGRLGCPECYKTFAEPLAALLKGMHKGTRHIGKTPESQKPVREQSDKVKQLQKRLAKAVEAEDFEQAAMLRDEIKQAGARHASPPTA